MNYKAVSDEDLRKLGVDEGLLDQRRNLNEKIKKGYRFAETVNDGIVECRQAFISNPNGYPKVFLLNVNMGIVDHFVGEMLGIQLYSCEKCNNKYGYVFFKEHDDVMTIANSIEDDHKKRSPNCDQHFRDLRLRND